MNTLLLIALVAGASSGPISHNIREQCATTCKASTKFGYDQGKTYEFRYESDTWTTLVGAAEEHSSLHITATANVEVLSPCEHVLHLKNVVLEDSDPRNLASRQLAQNHDDFRQALEQRPLRFAFQDGRVETLCAAREEPVWVLNVKRGILSTYQSSMETMDKDHAVTETDVAGNCQADYKITHSGSGSVTVQKTKNLLGCTDRQGARTTLQAMPYRVSSDVQSLPLMKSTHTCEQTVRPNGHLVSTTCREAHVFRPFSNKDSGATTVTNQKLSFVRQLSTTSGNVPVGARTTLLFDHSATEADRASQTEKAQQLIQELCGYDAVQPDTPTKFSQLVYTLRHLETSNMQALHRQIHTSKYCDNARKYFQDALPMVNTAASVSFMRDLMAREKVEESRVAMWLSSLAFINKPDADMIREAKGLLSLKQQEKTLLPVSALVNSFCRHDTRCHENAHVQEIVTILKQNLGSSCKFNTAPEKRKVMLSLKALGNIPASAGAFQNLKRCFSDYKNPIETRVLAIDAMRRMPCDSQRSGLMEVLQNTDEDSELRISAYLGLMVCPSRSTLMDVKQILESEEVNQVGSFIWTHLTNLQETHDSFKKDIASILRDHKLMNEFDMDKRKFSRNYEKSYMFHSLNVGGKMDSNMIWSQKSYVPRSGMLNLTVDVFGHSMNLLEIGGRVEGVDRLLETMLGPDGYLRKTFQKAQREKRSVTSPGQAEKLHEKYNQKPEDDLKGALYMRIFGNDLTYMDFGDVKNKKGGEFNILELLIQLAQDHQVSFSRSYMFLDSSVTVPTAAGLPLKLAVNGTATVNVNIAGKMDLRKLGTSPRSVEIDGHIKPSGAIEISSMMSVDAFHARTGLQMVSTLHSATAVEGKFKLEDSRVLTAKFNMPEETMQVLDVQSKFFLLHREKPRPQPLIIDNRFDVKKCTGERLEKALGLKVCGELAFSRAGTDAPIFPMTGPATAKVTLVKTDSHSLYEFEARVQSIKENVAGKKSLKHVARLAFNTPGSKVDRQLLFDLLVHPSQKNINFEVKTPWKRVAIGGAVTYTDIMKRLSARFMLDQTQEYSILLEAQVDSSGQGIKISPVIQVKAPQIKPVSISGNARYLTNQISADLSAENIFKEPLSFKGVMERSGSNKKTRIDTNMQFNSHMGSAKLLGYADARGGNIRSRFGVNYNLFTKKMHKMVFNLKTRDNSRANNKKYSANVAFQSTQFPAFNVEADGALNMNKRLLDNTISVMYGDNLKDPNKRIFFKQNGRLISKGSQVMVDHTAKFTFKGMNINTQTKTSHRHTPDEVKTQAVISYTPKDDVRINVFVQKKTDSPRRFNADLSLEYPGRELRLIELFEEGTGNMYHHEMTAQWQKKQQIKMISNYKAQGIKHEINTELQWPTGEPSTLAASVSLDPMNFYGKVQTQHQQKTYASSLAYNLAVGSGKSNIDISYPARHITASISGSRSGNTFGGRIITLWDADNDKSKKMIIDSRVKADIENLEAHLKVSHPARTIRALLDQRVTDRKYSSHAEVSWDKGQKISSDAEVLMKVSGRSSRYDGTVRITTPFSKYEHLKLHAGHKDDGSTMSSEADFTWAPDMTVTATNSLKRNGRWSNAEMTSVISTPFAIAKKLQLQTAYKFKNDDLNTNLAAEWNEHKIELLSTGSASLNKYRQNVQGTVTLKTTTAIIPEASIQGMYRKDKESVQTVTSATIYGKTTTVDIQGVNKGGRSNRDLQGHIKFTSPFNKVEKVTLIGKHEDDGTQYSTMINGQWMDKEASASMNVKNEGVLSKHQGNVEIKTPFEAAKHIATTWNHELENGKLDSRVELDLNGEKALLDIDGRHRSSYWGRRVQGKTTIRPFGYNRISTNFDVRYNKRGSVETSLSFAHGKNTNIQLNAEANKDDMTNFNSKFGLKTTFANLEDIAADVSLKTASEPATVHGQVQWAKGKVIAVDGDWTTSNPFKVNAKVNTPFAGFEDLRATGETKYSGSSVTTSAVLNYAPGQKIEVNTEYEPLKASVSLKTPFTYMRSLQGTGEHTGDSASFTNTMLITYVGKGTTRYASKVTVDGVDAEGNINLETPYEMVEDVALSFKHKMSGDYKTKVNVDVNKRHHIEGGYSLNFANGFAFESEVTTSFPVLKKTNIMVESSASGRTNQGKIRILADVAGETVEISSEGSVKPMEEIDVKGEMSSSISGLEKITTSASASMKDKRFVTAYNLEYAPRKNIVFSSLIDINGKLRGAVSLTTPFSIVPRLTAQIKHEGSLDRFSSSAEIDYSPLNGKLEALVDFKNADNGVNAQVTVSTPFEGYERSAATFRHKIERGNEHSSMLVVRCASKQVKLQAELKTPSYNEMEGSGRLTSSFNVIRDIRYGFKHSGSLARFTSHGETQINGGKKTEIDVSFTNEDNIAAAISFKSPISGAQDINAAFHHKGDFKAFETHAEVSQETMGKMEADLSITVQPSVLATFALKTPYTKDIGLQLTHAGNMDAFRTHAEYVYGGKKEIEMDADAVLRKQQVTLNARLSTPFRKAENTVINFSNILSGSSLNSKLSVEYFDGKVVASVDSSVSSGFTLKSALNTPYTENAELLVSHQGGKQRFVSSANLKYAGEALADAKLDFSAQPIITGKFTLRSAVTDDIEATITHTGAIDNFRCTADVIIGSQTHRATASFKSGRSTEASATASSPLVGNAEVNFKNQLNKRRMATDAFISYNGKKVELDSSIVIKPSVKVQLVAKTPFDGYTKSSFQMNFDHTKEELNGRVATSLEDRNMLTTDLKVTKSPVSVTFSLQSQIPHLEDITFNLQHQGAPTNCRTDASFQYEHGTITLSSSMQMTNGFRKTLQLTTPYRAVANVELTVDHQGVLPSFENGVTLKVPQGIYSYKGSFRPIKGDFQISIPQGSYQTIFNYNMESNVHTGSASILANREQIASLNGRLELAPQVKATLRLKTPLPYAEDWHAEYTKDVSYRNRNYHAEVGYKGEKVALDVQASTGRTKSLKVTGTSPFSKFEKTEFTTSFEGTVEEFSLKSKLDSAIGTIEISTTFNMEPLEGAIVLKTPFEVAKEISSSFKYITGTKAYGEVVYNGQKIAVEADKTPTTVQIRFTSPFDKFEDVTYSGTVEGDIADFTFNQEIKYFKGTVSASGKFSVSPLEAKLLINTPYGQYNRMAVNFKHTQSRRALKTSGNVNIPYGRFRLDSDIRIAGDLSADIRVKTPFDNFGDIKIVGQHQMNAPGIRTTFDIDRDNKKDAHLDLSVKFTPNLDIKVGADSQYTSPLVSEFALQAKDGNIGYDSRMTYGNTALFMSTLQASTKDLNALSVTYTLHTAFKYVQDIMVKITKNGDMSNLDTKTEIRYAKGKSIVTDVKFTAGSSMDGSVSINTPFDLVRSAGASFSHKGYGKNFGNQVEITYNKSPVLTAKSTFTFNKRISGEFSVETMGKDLNVQFSHQGQARQFANSAEIKYGDKTVAFFSNFNMGDKISGSARLTTPFASFESMSASFSHEGGLQRFSNEAELTYSSEKTIRVETTFSHGGKTTGSFRLTTPFKSVDEIRAAFEHSGNLEAFQDKIELHFPEQQAINAEAAFSLGETTTGSISLTSPYQPLQDVSLSFHNKGSLAKFTNGFQVQITPREIIKVGSSFSLEKKITGSFSLSTPFKAIAPIRAAFTHEGPVTGFKNNAELSVGSKLYNAESAFSTGTATSGSVSLSAPEHSSSLTFSHRGSMKNFMNKAQMQINSQTYTAESAFSANDAVTGSASITAPQLSSSLTFNHKGNLMSFENKAEMQINRQSYSAETAFSTRDAITGSASISAPQLSSSLTFSHKGGLKNFENKAQLQINRQSYTAESALSTGRAVTGSVSITAPQLSSSLTLNHQGTMKNFRNKAQMEINGQSYTAESSFKNDDVITGMVKSQSPMHKGSLKFNHEGSLRDFSNNAELNVNGKLYKGETKFSTGESTTGNIIISAETNKASLTLKHEGSLKSFNNMIVFEFNGKTYKGESIFSCDDKTTGTVRVFTPSGDHSLSFNHEGSLMKFNNMAELQIAGSRYNAESAFSCVRKCSGSVKISTPQGRHSFNFNHEGSLKNFNNMAELKLQGYSYKAESAFSTGPRTAGSLKLFRPGKEYSIVFSHDGTITNFNNMVELKCGKILYKAQSTFVTGARTNGDIRVFTPIDDYSLTFDHQGNAKQFRNTAELNLGDKKFSAQSNFANGRQLTGSATVSTPYTKTMEMAFNHRGDMSEFNSDGQVSYGSKQFKGETTFSTKEDKVSGSVKIQTPFRQVRDVSASVAHAGSIKRFNNVVVLTYAPNKSVQLNTAFRHEEAATDGRLEILTPWTPIKTLTVNAQRDGSIENLKVSGGVSHNGKNRFEAQGTLNFNGLSAFTTSFSAESTFPVMKDISASIVHRSTGYSQVDSDVNARFNGRPVLGVSAKHNTDRASASGSLSLRHPVAFSAEYDLKNTATELSGKTTINKAYQVIFTNKRTKGYRGNEKQTLSLQTVVPTRTMLVSSEVEKSTSRFQHSGVFSWNMAERKQVSSQIVLEDRSRYYQTSYYAKARLDTPVRSVETEMTHEKSGDKVTSAADLRWDAARNPSSVLSLKNIYEKSGSVHKEEVTIKAPGMDEALLLKGELTVNHGSTLFLTKASVDYNRNPSDILTMSVKLADESSSESFYNYTASVQATHVRSTVDVRAVGHIASNNAKASSGLSVSYLTARRQTKTAQLIAEIQKLQKEISLKMVTPVKSLEMSGKMSETPSGVFNIDARASADEKTVSANAKVDTNAKSFEMEAKYNPENTRDVLRVLAAYPTKTEIEAEVYHVSGGRRTTDAILTMNLQKKHLLHTRMYWRPSMYYDTKYGSLEMVRDMKEEAVDTWGQIVTAAKGEMRSKRYNLINALPNARVVFDALVRDAMVLFEDMGAVATEWNRMVQENEFFLKDIKAVTDKMVTYLNEKIEVISRFAKMTLYKVMATFERVAEDIDALFTQMKNVIADANLRVCRAVNKITASLYESITKATAAAKDMVRDAQIKAMKIATKLSKKAMALQKKATLKLIAMMEDLTIKAQPFMDATANLYANVINRAKVFKTKIQAHPRYIQVARKLNSYKRTVTEKATNMYNFVSQINWMKPLKDVQFITSDKIQQALAQLKKYSVVAIRRFNNAYNTLEANLNQKLEDISEHPHCKFVRNMLNEAYHKVQWAYDHYEIEERVKDGFRDAMTLAVRFVRKNALYLAVEYLKIDQDKLISYDPSKAELEFQVYLPMEWPHLQTLPALDLSGTLKQFRDDVSQYLPTDYSLWDTYYKYKPSSDINNWVPPFKAVASISGNQHYTTFDGRTFDFAGTCSYLLSRDMVDGTFSISVNYQNTRRGTTKSITVESNGKSIEISADGKVKVDGTPTELPIQFLNTTVSRHENTITLVNSKGLTFEHDIEFDACTIEIAGWFFGKTAGLLGTYNNEPSDDFTTSDRKKVTDVKEFAQSWEVSSCRSHDNQAKTVLPIPGSRSYKVCEDLFKSRESPFRKCFKQVNPDPFFRMCVHDAENDVENKRSICKTAALYVRHCKVKDVPLRMPHKCMRCETMEPGQKAQVTESDVPQSADVVFVLEQKQCNKEAAAKIASIARNIELSLRTQRTRNNRYGLVSFGANGALDKNQVHTVDGGFFSDVKAFRKAADIEFVEDGANTDSMSAVHEATKYPFRSGVSKNIILVTCGSCEDMGSFQKVKDTMTSMGFVFHVLKSHEFQLNGDMTTPKTNYLFGIDKETSFTSKHIRDRSMKGDKELFAHILRPSDKCYELAEATNGAYFNLDKLVQGRTKYQKHFLDVFSRRVAKTADPATCQECECVADDMGNTRTICKPCAPGTFTPSKPLLGRPDEEPKKYYEKVYKSPSGKIYRKEKSASLDQFDMDFKEFLKSDR